MSDFFWIRHIYWIAPTQPPRQKSEDNLAMAESELDKHTKIITEFTRKVDELQIKADEAVKLKDQVDEYVKFIWNLDLVIYII